MKNYIKTKFLTHYFLTCVTLPETVNKRDVFFTLAKMYGIDDTESLFSVCESDIVKGIDSVAEYYMHARMKKIPALKQEMDKLSEDTQLAITIKGQALMTVDELKLRVPNKLTSTEIISHIVECANEGIIVAMFIYGFALCEGQGVPQNKESGLRYLQKAVRWNSTEAAIMCMTYDSENAKRYADVLMSLAICPFVEAVEQLAKPFGVTPEKDSIATLLEKAFSRGIAKREKYDHSIARVLYCTGLNYADKQSTILSNDRDYLNTVANFPLNLPSITSRDCTPATLMGRVEERGKIARALRSIQKASEEKYRPLLLRTDEEFLADSYIESFEKSFKDFNIVIVDVAMIEDEFFENGAHNIVIKELSEKKLNLVLFRIYGEITVDKAKVVNIFLSAEDRKEFLVAIGLTLDLSNILPIVVCDAQNAERFKRKCRVIELANISAEERKEILLSAVGEHSTSLGIEISVDDDIWSSLGNENLDTLIGAIDTVCMSLTEEDSKVTFEKMQKYICSMSRPSLGFRGEL